MNNKLIFDLGFHRGDDTDFYLNKGFNVVALEANPHLIAKAKEQFAGAIAENRLHLVEAALTDTPSEGGCHFFLSSTDRWGSTQKEVAERGGAVVQKINVQGITLPQLLDGWGMPYYIKCDIPGANGLAIRQLLGCRQRPKFLSFSEIELPDLAFLYGSGYGQYQLLNNFMQPKIDIPYPSSEGLYFKSAIKKIMHGLFGDELFSDKWLPYEELYIRYSAWKKLKEKDGRLVPGRIILHARFANLHVSEGKKK